MNKKNLINLTDYYNQNHEYEFFINSINLFDCSVTSKIIDEFSSLNKADETNNIFKKHSLQSYISTNLDEFNFLIVRLGVILELSLKGIAIKKGYNIFKEIKGLRIYSSVNKEAIETYELNFFLDNLDELLSEKQVADYKNTFEFIRFKRNQYIHFSERQYMLKSESILNHLVLFKQYMEEVIRPLKDDASSIKANEKTYN